MIPPSYSQASLGRMETSNPPETTAPSELRKAAEALVLARVEHLERLAEHSQTVTALRTELARAEEDERNALAACQEAGWTDAELRQLGLATSPPRKGSGKRRPARKRTE